MRSFSKVFVPCVVQSDHMHFINLTKESELIYRLANQLDSTGCLEGMSMKEIRHIVSDLIRHHCHSQEFQVKGTKRTINGVKHTVYYGLKRVDAPEHAYNPKTKKAIFKYRNQVYRIHADSQDHALELFHQSVHNREIVKELTRREEHHKKQTSHSPLWFPTCPFRAVRPEIRRIEDPFDWKLDVEDRLKRTYRRRYGREMPKMLE